METGVLIALILPFLLVPVVGFFGPRMGARVAWLALPAPAIGFAALLHGAISHGATPQVAEWQWIPYLGVNFSLLIDGFSLFFGLVVAGVGALVVFYSRHYLDDHYEHHGRFYAYLLLFMGAMQGTVFSNNLLLLFVFWELTGISSFLLIGFFHHESVTRTGARMALLVTASTGLLLLVGVVMLRQWGGTFDLSALLSMRADADVRDLGALFTGAMVCIALGAFGKSAQFPFHFWLPNAMAAPTPVSAYLHSATMVKLGVFLCGRMSPLFADMGWWTPLLASTGIVTMLLGAWFALLSHDLKSIFAYSTVSTLGMLIAYYGLAPGTGAKFDYLHIASHVFFKGCLFMVAGIVDHTTGTRDVRQLGGLGRRVPVLALICGLALASMASLPGTVGFISKEMLLKESGDWFVTQGVGARLLIAAVLLATVFKVALSLRVMRSVFLGTEPPALAANYHRPGWGVLFPPMVLAAAGVVFGVVPSLLSRLLYPLRVDGMHNFKAEALAFWHGWNLELGLSIGSMLLGVGLFMVLHRRGQWHTYHIPGILRFDLGFTRMVEALPGQAKWITRLSGADSPLNYLLIMMGFLTALTGGMMLWLLFGGHLQLAGLTSENFTVKSLRIFVGIIIILSVIGAMVLSRWTTRLVSLSAAGFLVTFYFVLYRAPDLALTQILVETVTLLAVLLLLGRFPESVEKSEIENARWNTRKTAAAVISTGVGLVVFGFIALCTLNPHPDKIGYYFLEASKPFGAGTNAVNVILVDFRGFDTLGEITVLVIAMLGCLGLLMRYKRTPEELKEGDMGEPGMGIHHEDSQP